MNKREHTILLVDDEPDVLRALERAFFDEPYNMLTANNGPAALELMAQEGVDLIISDQRMPGMTGADVLEAVYHRWPNVMRMVLTGYADVNAAEAAINRGHAHRYLRKPWDDRELKLAIREALAYHDALRENERLQQLTERQNIELKTLNNSLELKVQARTREIEQKNRELEKNFFDTVTVLAGLISVRDHFAGGHAERVSRQATRLAETLSLSASGIRDIRVAALLHNIGIIGLSKNLLHKNEMYMSEVELSEYRKHPLIGQACLQVVESLSNVALIVRHHRERFDGNGYPDGLRGRGIPIGARILAVVIDYDLFTHKLWQNKSEAERRKRAIERLENSMRRRYDPQIVNAFIAFLNNRFSSTVFPSEQKVNICELEGGMVLARDIYTTQGVLLAAEGMKLTPLHILKIRQFDRLQPIVDGVYIYAQEGD